ncbi:putative purple acid phosphatase-like protein [Thermomicrobium roseum DSM 5159]|jgi:hypothetical protein|uniref:Putative purple acid phosphatase-like protein n=2 Tax=Thermomicrobium roseum TaxID=500 RepID=B9KXF3_THERP|nr:putative purple acid phosphatase-like protein [Thermomicrobium roseum DSM 5159]
MVRLMSRLRCSIIALVFLAACTTSHAATITPHATEAITTTSATPARPVILWAVGDAATCRSKQDDEIAAFLAQQPGIIALLGDVVYERGTPEEFARCFDPLYGPLKDRLRPAVGNHEYGSRDAGPYFEYFGARAGLPGQGWYSYDLGEWHIIVLNSNCKPVGGCDEKSPQYQWLKADLTTHPARCTLAYWHHPRWSSGEHGSFESMQPIWSLLVRSGVDIVLSGHDHDYERFQPLDADGHPDPRHGTMQFVVGTGGRSLRPLGNPLPTSAIGTDTTFGVLRLELYPDHYSWEFVTIPGANFTDSGSAACH